MIGEVIMTVERHFSLPVPHEITAVIPRAEIRSWRYRNGRLSEASELILNSVTIAHSPVHSERQQSSVSGEQLKPEGPAKNSLATWKYLIKK
jgi:hypothetical protein